MLFNMEKPEEGVRELMVTGNQFHYQDFSPHGISVLEDKSTVHWAICTIYLFEGVGA